MDYDRMWEELEAVSNIENWRDIWQECADWGLPLKDNILKVNVSGTRKPVQRFIDTCIAANYTFATGFFSRMFPAGNIWGKFKHPDPDINADELVAEYFELVSREIHSILAESNFTQEMQESLMDIGVFGTNCLYVEPDDDDVVRFSSFPISSLRIGANSKGKIDIVGREFELTSRQMLQQFGEESLREAGMSKVMDEISSQCNVTYKVKHMVFPREEYNAQLEGKSNKKFASIYTVKGCQKPLREGGYTFIPYFIGRFATGNNEVYGRSPMMNVLGTARRSNVIKRSLIAIAELNASPQWLVRDDDSVSGISNRANAIIKYRIERPERLDTNGNPALASEIYEAHDTEIRQAFFNHLFRPLDDYRNMTAFEAQSRQSIDLMSLTPFASRYYDEVVTPMLTYVYRIAQKSGRLPQPPQLIRDNPSFKVEFVGQLSLATMSFETSGAFSVMNMFAEVAQYSPKAQAAFDNIDFDKTLRRTWYNQNASMAMLKPIEEVEDDREAEAKMMAQKQAQESMQSAAQAYSMSTAAPEPGSGAARVMEGME